MWGKLRHSGIFLLVMALTCLFTQPTFAQKNKKRDKDKVDESDYRAAEFYFIDGEKYFILEDYAKSLEAFHKSLDIVKDNDVVYFKIAEIMYRNGQFDEAEESITTAIELNSNNKYYYLLAADVYSAKADYSNAALMYEKMILAIPESEEYYLDLVGIYLFQNKLDDALRVFKLAENKYGVVDQISFQIQQIYLKQNKIDEAIEVGRQLVASYPGEPRYVVALAEVMNSNDRRLEAIQTLEGYLSSYEDVSRVKLRLADYYRLEQEYDESTKMIRSAFSDPDLTVELKIQVIGGYISRFPDTYSKETALELGKILVEVHPDNGEVYLINADMIYSLVRTDSENANTLRTQASQYYQKGLSYDPGNFKAWQNYLNIDLDMQHWDSLTFHAENALELFPNQPFFYLFAGIGYTQIKQYEEAVSYLEQGKKMVSNNPQLLHSFHTSLGSAYNALGDYKNSDKSYDAAIALNPNDDIALNNYSYYLSLRKENLEKARKMAEGVVRRNPVNPTYLDTYAWVLYQLEEYDEAKQVIEAAIRNNGTSAVYFDHYGDILFKLGQVNEAVENWEKAKSLNENLENINKKISRRKVIE